VAKQFRHEDIAAVPHGWKVRTVTHESGHRVRVAFPPGRKEKGSGRLVSILHPQRENPMCSTLRFKNPAELLLMGANPHKKTRERVTNPILNASFTQNEKLELGRLGIAWSGIKTAADVRKARKAIRDANKIRSRFGNPMPIAEQRDRAQEIYTGFHATPAENKIVMDEPHIPAGVYPELGLLYGMTFKPTNPDAREHYEKVYRVPRENVHVIGSLQRDQLHFAGGDQQIDEKTLRFFGWNGEDLFEMGDARTIVYLARKYHQQIQEDARGEIVEWVHPFGEETGVLPKLMYDHTHKRVFLKHGEYRIQDEGITN
jgi:hypothetical protein